MNKTEDYSRLLNGRLPTSDLEYELCDRLIEKSRQKMTLQKQVGELEQKLIDAGLMESAILPEYKGS